MIRNIFLDLDNTLLDFQRGERVAISQTLNEINVDSTEALVSRYMEINLACWRALERGEMTRDEVLYGRFQRLFDEIGYSASAKAVQDRYQDILSRQHDFMPGAKELLDALRESKKYRLYIATNGIPEVQYPRIADSGIGEYFDGIFISYEIGYPKPKREFFEGCFVKIKEFKREQTIIVGDSLTSDIMGGINARVATCHYNVWGDTYGEIIPDYTINNLSELIPLLDSIE